MTAYVTRGVGLEGGGLAPRVRFLCPQNSRGSTGLAPKIGYDQAAAVSKKAFESDKTIREVLLEDKIMSEKEFNDWLRGQFK